jgi:AcrR family transcriptional regulator
VSRLDIAQRELRSTVRCQGFVQGRVHGATVATNQRRRSVEERRAQLVDAAIAVLAEEGIAAATTRRITERAGVALGAFHYAFESKDELLQAVIERFSDEIEQLVIEAADGPVDDLAAFAERVVDAYWASIERTPDLQLAQYELTVYALRDPKLRALAELQYERFVRAVTRVIERVPELADGAAREHLARYLSATMDGLILHYIVQRDEAAARVRLALYVRAIPTLVESVREQA